MKRKNLFYHCDFFFYCWMAYGIFWPMCQNNVGYCSPLEGDTWEAPYTALTQAVPHPVSPLMLIQTTQRLCISNNIIVQNAMLINRKHCPTYYVITSSWEFRKIPCLLAPETQRYERVGSEPRNPLHLSPKQAVFFCFQTPSPTGPFWSALKRYACS